MPPPPTSSPSPSAPPANPRWDGHVAAAAAATPVTAETGRPDDAATVPVAQAVPFFPPKNPGDGIEYATTTATATATAAAAIPFPPPTAPRPNAPTTAIVVPARPVPPHDPLAATIRAEERFSVDGRAGADGSRPARAPDGRVAGDHGLRGTDASPGLRGEDGGTVDVTVSTEGAGVAGKVSVRGSVSAGPRREGDAVVAGPSVTTHFVPMTTDFAVSARGGRGGDGGVGGSGGDGVDGFKGRNATRYSSGGSGGPGGNGGDAGAGSDGGDGGAGGEIHIRIRDEDSYYLMAFPCCAGDAAVDRAVRGGAPGRAGGHGAPGAPGRGGRGGRSYSWTESEGFGEDRRTVHRRNPGGSAGPSGVGGRVHTHPLQAGTPGGNGKLTIHVDDGSRRYGSRYDLRLSGASLRSTQRLHQHDRAFQFTDTIRIADLSCQNIGGMISPLQGSDVHFEALTSTKLRYIVPNADGTGWFHTRLDPEGIGPVQGELSLRIRRPDVRDLGDDAEPYRARETFRLGATQRGAHGFRRAHPNFHAEGATLDLRFPVESRTGFEGLPTLRAGEGTHVAFRATNTSLRDLGTESEDGRRLAVQFHRNPREEYDVASVHVDLRVDGAECNSKLDEVRGRIGRGTSLEIAFLGAGETKTFRGTLRLDPQVAPYSRLAIQAEILLEELGRDGRSDEAAPSAPEMMPVQRRQLEVSTEPTYVPSADNHAVLVTCATTTKEQFNAWSDLLIRRLGLNIEYYSVSIYGSLDPDFRPSEGGNSLAQAFARKLVVVLDDIFNPLDASVSKMEPSRMLPNGSQSQTSGYDESTRWLLAGSSDDAVEQALMSHFTAPPNDVTPYDSPSAFEKATKEQLQKERKDGVVSDERICESAIKVEFRERSWKHPRKRSIETIANAVKTFLEKTDPLRQYVVEPRGQIMTNNEEGTSYQLLVVRRGYCRTANTTNILQRAIPPRHDDGNALLAVVKSLPIETLILVFCNVVSSEDSLLKTVIMDVFIQHLIWEVSNVLDGRLNVRNTDDLSEVFPTLEAITLSSELKQIGGGTGGGVCKDLSKLLARLECVANSRDLRPTPLPLGLRRAVRRTLLKMVATLQEEWAEITSDEDKRDEVQLLQEEVLAHLKNTYGSPFLRTKTSSRWRKGLLYVCSHRNTEKYKDAGFCGPTVRLCEMETLEYMEKSRAIAPSKMIASEDACRGMRQQATHQKDLASQLLNSIEDTRNRMCLGNEGEVEVQLPGTHSAVPDV